RAMKTILIVEDHAEVREPLARLLKIEGYQTFVASNGNDALKTLAAHSVDLMLLDLMMPRMDGLTLMHLVRNDARHAQVPILILTGMIEGSALAKAKQLATAVLFKSRFTLDELFARVRQAIENPPAIA